MRDAIARLIDPDAWHETLPTDGCGVYWIGRRSKARSQADAILALLSTAGRDTITKLLSEDPICQGRVSSSTIDALAALVGSGWQDIETAPRDGTEIDVIVPFRVKWHDGFMDEDENPCGGWVAIDDDEHPENWSGGACWSSNHDEVPSSPPTAWRPAAIREGG